MIYVVSLIGFIGGFMLGQLLLLKILRKRSNDELLKDKSLHWIYGTLNWAIAIICMSSAAALYGKYIAP